MTSVDSDADVSREVIAPSIPAAVETTEDDAGPSITVPTNRPAASVDELLLFFPQKVPADQRPETPVGLEDVEITSLDGTRLHAWWRPHPQPVAEVLYLHGNAGNLWMVSGFMQWLHDNADCAVLAVDYRGYGLSEGAPTVDGVLKDVRAARDELRRRSVDRREVIIGRSLGGALAVDLAADDPPRGLVLEATFASFREVARVHAGSWANIVPANRLDSRTRLAKYPGPLLQVHGDADRLVPFEQGTALHEAATGPKRFLCSVGCGHNNFRTPEYRDELVRFLRELP
jgi:fermentation-respiration switch protein FrsA (DUF1100 family)